MRTVRLGERTVTASGCGDLSLAIAASRGVDRRDVERALTVALELGLTLADIHPGEDDAERLAGDVIRALRLRDSVIVATAVPPRSGHDTPIQRLPPAYLQSRVEAALRNTRLDALPLVQLPLHPSWIASKAWPELEGTAARLVREGKVLAWGARLEDIESEPDRASDEPSRGQPAVSGAWVSHDSRVRPRGDREARLGDRDAGAAPDGDRDAGDAWDCGERAVDGELRALLAVPWLVSLSVPYNLCARAAEPLIAAASAPVPLGPEAPPPAPPVSSPTSSLIVSAFEITAPLATTTAPMTSPKPTRRAAPLAVLARHPLAGGALAGTLGPGHKLAQRDDRNAIDDATLDRIALQVARLAPLARTLPPAARATEASREVHDRVKRREHAGVMTLAELALRYVIDRGAIALPRLHRHTLVADALIAAASEPLPAHANAWILDEES